MRKWNLLTIVATCCCALAAPALAAEEQGHGGETNIFNADIGNFVATLIIFGLVVYILGKFAWKPLLNVLNEREQSIRHSLEAAREERVEAEQLLADYKAQITKARDEATAIVEEGRRDADVVARRLQEQARQEAEQVLERARREIKLATDVAVRELYDQTAELAVKVAGGILRKEISPEEHRQLVADSLEEMGSADSANMN